MPSLSTKTIDFNGDALAVFRAFAHQPQVFFLDSSLSSTQERFSYIGFRPFKVVTSLEALRRQLKKHRMLSQGSAFPAGAVGYLGYDGRVYFGLYDDVITIDHHRKRLTISKKNWDTLTFSEKVHKKVNVSRFFPSAAMKSNFTKAQYVTAVRKALAHIKAGDIYQINLSQKFEHTLPSWQNYASAADVYASLRGISPSPLSAYLHDGKRYILSSSPERFLKLNGRHVQVCPMKGTRPRGATPKADARLYRELLGDPKEIAELLMVTDLERNDLGRVCEYGSVKVTHMRAIEKYATVFQATSTIEGCLHKNFDHVDLLKATFPSGSVTGCPKIAAMNIIDQLEHGSRGLYTGALGYISFTGHMDFNVMIRTLFMAKDKISFHVGGGIVADSNPHAEYEETLLKAKAMQQALRNIFSPHDKNR